MRSIMKLKSTIILKLLVLSFFILAFFAPSILSATPVTVIDKAEWINSSQLHNTLFYGPFEELFEQDKACNQNVSIPGHCILNLHSHLIQFKQAPLSFSHTLQQFNTHPPLFRTLCTILI